MTEPELPEALLRSIGAELQSYEAVVLLVVLSREPERRWPASALAGRMLPEGLTGDAVDALVPGLVRAGLVAREADGTIRFAPASEDLAGLAATVREAYDRRPVTLVRTMKALAAKPPPDVTPAVAATPDALPAFAAAPDALTPDVTPAVAATPDAAPSGAAAPDALPPGSGPTGPGGGD